MFRRENWSIEPCEEPSRRKDRETGCCISIPLRLLSSRNIWSTDPDDNTISYDSSIQFGGQKIFTMAGKNPDITWKTTDYEMSGQLKKLENEQAELLKIFDGNLADVKSHLAQNKTLTAEKAFQYFFETMISRKTDSNRGNS